MTALTLVSFVFMASLSFNQEYNCFPEVRQVLSSVIAAWSDVSNALQAVDVSSSALGASFGNIETVSTAIRRVNVGYFWMLSNCLTSATYVRFIPTVPLFHLFGQSRYYQCVRRSSKPDSLIGIRCS